MCLRGKQNGEASAMDDIYVYFLQYESNRILMNLGTIFVFTITNTNWEQRIALATYFSERIKILSTRYLLSQFPYFFFPLDIFLIDDRPEEKPLSFNRIRPKIRYTTKYDENARCNFGR